MGTRSVEEVAAVAAEIRVQYGPPPLKSFSSSKPIRDIPGIVRQVFLFRSAGLCGAFYY